MSQHPLRRISTGSLFFLARSQSQASPSGLDWLEPALTDLADEASTLSANIARMNELHTALERFNEGFSAYLYALKINAFCVEWNEAPDVHSWQRLQELSGESSPGQADGSARTQARTQARSA
jgi:DASH complex subunit DAM1